MRDKLHPGYADNWRLYAAMALLVLALLLSAIFGAFAQGPPSSQTTNPITQDGSHLVAGGPAPAISSGCGTGATITGSDVAFHILTGTATSQPCTITFAQTYQRRPTCMVSGETANVSSSVAANGLSMALTSLVDLTRYHVLCIGRP